MVVRLPELKKYLNRDGLEVYNSLLPHSSTEIEEYVGDWLDAHPEATTTVQDGSITAQKLAAKCVTRGKLADDVTHLLAGMMLTKDVTGNDILLNDAYTVGLLEIVIDGKSTQNGAPTPEMPVPIENIETEALEITISPKNVLPESVAVYWTSANGWYTSGSNKRKDFYFGPNQPFTVSFDLLYSISTNPTQNRLYVTNAGYMDLNNRVGHFVIHGTADESGYGAISINTTFVGDASRSAALANVQIEAGSIDTSFSPYFDAVIGTIPMQGNILSYLNEAVYDTLTLRYEYDSDTDGMAVYSADLYKMTDYINLGAYTWGGNNVGGNAEKWYTTIPKMQSNVNVSNRMCSAYTVAAAVGTNSAMQPNTIAPRATDNVHTLYVKDSRYSPADTTPQDFKSAIDGFMYLYRMDGASRYHVDLGLIELPIIKSNGVIINISPDTNMHITYMRNSNNVIRDIELAIADM